MDDAVAPIDDLVVVETGDWFDAFYRQQRNGMVRLAFVLVDDREVAEDIVQTAFARVYQRRTRIEAPLAYLRSSVYNGCRNHHRWARVRRRNPEARDGTQPAVGDHVIDVVRRLPHRQRVVVTLHFYADMSDPEIAAAIGVPVGTVKSTLHRALAAMREELS
jgi:RNA polymerase sigma-70 factor (sigma-E family)